MVDHHSTGESQQKPKESIVRVKRIVNVVTGLLPGGEQQETLAENGSGDNSINTAAVSDKLKPHKKGLKTDTKKSEKKPLHKKTPPTTPHPKSHPKNQDRPFPEPPTVKLGRHPPTVVIAGVKCGGVSSLTQFISLHPQIQLTSNIYDETIHRANATKNTTNISSKPKTGQVIVDVSPELFTTSQISTTLKRLVPSLKLVLMLRDPFDRSLSCYHETVNRLEGSGIRSFEDLVLTSKGRVNTNSELVTSSLYDVHLIKWLKTYNITHWLFMDYYQLSTQPYNTLRRLEKFLGVQPFFHRDDFTYNKQQLLCLSQKRSKKLKLNNHLCLQSNSTVSEVSLGADTEDQLKDYFTSHMEKLLSLVSSQIYLGDLVSLMN